MFCPQCGAASPQKTNFCKKCGASMNLAANTVEVHLPRAGVAGMVWAIAGFSMVGLIASLIMLGSMSGPGGLPDGAVVFAFIGCLIFVLSVAGMLTWQLARLINTYRDAVSQTINKAQFEVSPPPPQPQPVYIPAAQAAERPSVVEHTTRQMAGVYGESRE
jgi:hypothetical protein